MLKKLIPASIMLLLTYSIEAQTTSHQTLNSAGNTAKISSFTIDFAVGETITETLKGNSSIVTQGFIQPVITIQTGFSFQKQGEGCQFSIFPNPTTDYINFKNQDTEEVDFEIYKIDGSLVGKYRSVNKYTDVSTLAKGTYLVKLLCDNTNNSIQKFVKL
jgi:Secretion system C-terminal sorting domain